MKKINWSKIKTRHRYRVECFHMAYLECNPKEIIACVPYGVLETTAASKEQAINNVRFRLENQSQYSIEQHRDEIWYYEYRVTDLGIVGT